MLSEFLVRLLFFNNLAFMSDPLLVKLIQYKELDAHPKTVLQSGTRFGLGFSIRDDPYT